MEEGLLGTLAQFYDPLYRCFTFPDYQLVPNLEEFSYFIGLPITDTIPYTGLEGMPKAHVISEALHLRKKEVEDNLKPKAGVLGFSAKFLIEKARMYAQAGSSDAFEAMLALLIYGIILFPRVDHFVDITAIQVFLIKNPVPTLLADVLYSTHWRTMKRGGTILCCAPLLYRWFVSHLPQAGEFLENREQLRWSQKLMRLTNVDIAWYSRVFDGTEIIDSCGGFPNVPLIGTKGAINCNPILARRQLGYPLKEKPINQLISPFILVERDDDPSMRLQIAKAWQRIHRKGKKELGKKDCVAWEPYTFWMQRVALNNGMPYPVVAPHFPPPQNAATALDEVQRLQDQLDSVTRERDTWKTRFELSEARTQHHRDKASTSKKQKTQGM